LDQNITYPPTAGTPTEGILTLQEEDAEDTPNNHLLCTLTTEPSNYEEQITEQEIRQMPVTPKAKLGGIGTAVEALPVQPYKIDQKCTLAPSNNILVDPDANECHSQLKMETPTIIIQVHNNGAAAICDVKTTKTITIIKPYHIQE
jgi:hypothetical protein